MQTSLLVLTAISGIASVSGQAWKGDGIAKDRCSTAPAGTLICLTDVSYTICGNPSGPVEQWVPAGMSCELSESGTGPDTLIGSPATATRLFSIPESDSVASSTNQGVRTAKTDSPSSSNTSAPPASSASGLAASSSSAPPAPSSSAPAASSVSSASSASATSKVTSNSVSIVTDTGIPSNFASSPSSFVSDKAAAASSASKA